MLNKRNRIIVVTSIILCVFLFFSCASAPKENLQIDGPVYVDNGIKELRLAVLQPKGVNIAKNQEWLLSMIQGSLAGDFNKFSSITVLDRQHLDDILNEQELSLNGSFSDDDYIKIGNLTNAQYILTGSLTKVTAVNFMLDLAITNPETGERLASFGPKQYSLSDIQSMLAAKDAAFDLLTQIGVELTANGKKRLYETTQASVYAETALAKGIIAEKSGATLVEVMQYYYQAVDYDAGMTEAINRLAETNGKFINFSKPLSYVPTGNIRADAQAKIAAYRIEQENKRIDQENKQVWLKQLADCENYFTAFFRTANAPLELVYSTDIQPLGEPDPVNETLSLYFQAAFKPLQSSWFRAAEQTIAQVRKGLVETGRAKDWELSGWPKQNVSGTFPFANEDRNYNITAILLDEQERIIAAAQFTLAGGWDCRISSNNEVSFRVRYESAVKDVVFENVKIDDITDILSVRFSSVNDIDIETATESGILAITPDNQQIKSIIKTNPWHEWRMGTDALFRFFLGYSYTPDLPGGFTLGLTENRFGVYVSFSSGRPAHSDWPHINNPSNAIEKQEEHSWDVIFGIYYRIINNFFVDVGIGTYINTVYGLYEDEALGSSEPVWCNIDGSGGTSNGFTLQAGLLYTFKWFYVSAGYRQYFDESYTSTFYGGVGVDVF
jgi:hypothetical protein